MEKCIYYGEERVGRLFRRFLLPTVLGMVSSALFVVTDGIFVGRGLGSDALAAVNLVAPFYTLATGIGLLFGMGASIVASISLAHGKRRMANLVLTQSAAVPAVLLILASAWIVAFPDPILRWVGTPDALLDAARSYLFWFALFLMPVALFGVLMFAVRLDGSPRFVMACNLISAGLNIVLDWLFIFRFGWGLAGAAAASGIGYVVGSILLLRYMFRHSRTIRFVGLAAGLRSLRFAMRTTARTVRIGFPALAGELAVSCMMIAGNYAFLRHAGKDGVAAYSIVCYLFPIIFMLYSGIVQAAQPIASYNHGIGAVSRVRKTLHLSLATSAGCGLLLFAATSLLAPSLASLFLSPDTPAHQIARTGLPLFAAGYLFFGINVAAIGHLQSLGRDRTATTLTVLRGIVLTALAFLFLPRIAGTAGIWLAVPAAEAVTTIWIIFVPETLSSKKL